MTVKPSRADPVAANVKWGHCDPASVAPLDRTGQFPDMRNYLPTRFVSYQEALDRGWKHFYTGETCRWGHRAPHCMSNIHQCVDCERVRDGKLPIGIKGVAELDGPAPARRKAPSSPGVEAPATELTPIQKLFLTKYVDTRNFAEAAKACGQSDALFLAQLSYDKRFREAVQTLESDNGLARTPSILDDYEWNEDKRRILLRLYIDTGDMLQAMKAIGVSNYHFEREMRENVDFCRDLEAAEEQVTRHWDRYAASAAGKGSERILQKYLAAIMPDKYGDKVKMDLNVTRNLTHEQLATQVAQQLTWLEGRNAITHAPDVLEAEFRAVEPATAVEVVGDDVRPPPQDRAERNSDLV